jgi:hypothetical protein
MSGGGGGGAPPPTAQEIALADRAEGQWEDYKTRFQPLIGEFASRTEATEQRRDQGKGLANTDVRIAAAGPNTTNDPIGTANKNNLVASASGLAAGSASTTVSSQDLGARLKLSAFGQGLADSSSQGLTQAAGNSTRLAIGQARNDYIRSQGVQGMFGTAAGAYTRYQQAKTA